MSSADRNVSTVHFSAKRVYVNMGFSRSGPLSYGRLLALLSWSALWLYDLAAVISSVHTVLLVCCCCCVSTLRSGTSVV